MLAFVVLPSDGRISVDDLITAQLPVERAAEPYERLLGGTSRLGPVLTCPPVPEEPCRVASVAPQGTRTSGSRPTIGVIGAGGFSQRVLIPGLRESGFDLARVASTNGLAATRAVERFGFPQIATPDELLKSEDLDAVAVATRDGSHTELAIRALERGNAAFVEKPPARCRDALNWLREAVSGRVLRGGRNQRFARDRETNPTPSTRARTTRGALPNVGRNPPAKGLDG